MLLVAACTPENDTVSSPALAPQPVMDSAPYICKLIPEQAFRLVSGVTGPLAEKTDGSQNDGDCWAPDTTPRPLEVRWMQEGDGMPREQLDFVLEDRRQVYSRRGGVTLPTDLGDGLAAYLPNSPFADQPYRVVAKFRCDGKEQLVTIYLARIAKGRDAIKDMTELMRIAQKRYGELYDCTPGT
ncbi:hypothetical protein ETD86_45355 [Nonomuraea turkmeniaca]|uniref:DUF3558 domain-containing protein n=1 Tax=Nonomuraea turkmeniaca TaxID=103838 RepID=A0A5S4EZ95_9ACTN|nr:hypothetical protein [Nonomuraea turkmeniaca]TMR09011.1 hypothetical protein ETD86_45355 [Nonomuraea turkmeniaca]